MRFGIVLNTQDPPRGDDIARIYDEAFREAEAAEQAGFELAVVGEHHHSLDGCLPSALTFCAALAARTSRMVVASDVMQLPMWHPLHVAEMGAVVDNISHGRFALGVGLGQRDRSAFGIPREGIVRRFEESVQIIRQAWANESFSYGGEYFTLDNVRISPRPVQRGGPPIWIGALSKPGLLRAGRLGDGWPTDNLQSLATIKEWANLYRQTAAEHSRKSEVLLARSAWIGDNRSDIAEQWWPRVRAFFQPYAKMGLFKDLMLAGGEADWTFERIGPDRLIAGTPDDVVGQIERYRTEIGCETLILLLRHPQGPSHQEVLKCIARFGQEIIPHFQS
ncbi:MAG: LLM class flavin-dependent oxidoreductase [Acidobacteriota bacterium]|nr:LLM class flavin-dependent oxidoreductase [Blastocatellia bacterium]MDW8238297.1 LLM class flavin-dependent oxidoreductase [Acidobacteriota bacterium]